MSLLVKRADGGKSVQLPVTSVALLRRHYPNTSDVRAASVEDYCVDWRYLAPTDMVLFGQSEVGGPLEPQEELRTSTHIWSPCKARASKADHVVFVGEPLQDESNNEKESLNPQIPFQLRVPTAEAKAEEQRKADFDKKQTQLKAALESNKRAYAEAKKSGEVVDVGALAIERDRIEEELAVSFVPHRVSRSEDTIDITPLSIELPLGYFKHPESALQFRLVKSANTTENFKQLRPQMMVNKRWVA